MGQNNNMRAEIAAALKAAGFTTLKDAAHKLGITAQTLRMRILNGWTIARAFTPRARTFAQLETLTGYTPTWARQLLRNRGVNWKWAPEAEIRAAVTAHLEEQRKRAAGSIAAHARRLGIGETTLHERIARHGLEAALAMGGPKPHSERRRRGGRRHGRRLTRGRPPVLPAPAAVLAREIGLSRSGIYAAAKRNGRTILEELEARRSDAAHAPASSVASDQRRGMVSRAGAVSACVASGSGANDSREVAA